MGENESSEEFLTDKGTIEMILVIGEDGAHFDELVEKTNVSHDTVDKRVDAGRKLGFFTTEATTDTSRNYKWVLEAKGYTILEKLQKQNADKSFYQLNKARQDYQKSIEPVKNWINKSNEILPLSDKFNEEHPNEGQNGPSSASEKYDIDASKISDNNDDDNDE